MKFNQTFITLFLVLVFTACKKDNSPHKSETDVYIAGYMLSPNGAVNQATIWKNGTTMVLPDHNNGAQANAIAINGNDVYVVGTIIRTDFITNTATIWKNGQPTFLTDSLTFSRATCIAIDGNDVYVGGYSGWNPHPTIWKNGVPTVLSNTMVSVVTSVDAIAVKDGDVYVSGASEAPNNFTKATYWKNTVASFLTDNDLGSEAYAMAFNGADIYFGGTTSTNNGLVATIWKNGVPEYLKSGRESIVNAITLNGSDLYLAGKAEDSTTFNFWATYWKNGISTNLTNSSTKASANGIAVNNGEVYVAGESNGNAVYWKNGTPTVLAQKAKASGIAIVTH